MREAHGHLVFLHDDRAPHGLAVVCKRWYMREMAKYLSDSTVFEACDHSWEDVEKAAIEFNQKWGFATGDGVVYNYGIWKPTKNKFRYIAGTRSKPWQPSASRRPPGPPRQPLYHAHKELVRLLQQVEKTLLDKDKLRQANEGVKAFWGIDSIRAFTAMVRTNPDVILEHGQITADFCTMYTAFPFNTMINRTMESIGEAFTFEHEKHPPLVVDGAAPRELSLGPAGWSYEGEGYSIPQLRELLTYLVTHNFTSDGGKVRRQIQGMPMGMPAAPQIANLACYPVEKAHAYALGPGKSLVVCRYIDDLYSAGVPLPPPEAYGMEYKKTGEGDSVVYLGTKVYILKSGEHREVHTTVFDREEAYPHHIVRYPEFGTVAPPQQLGGVIMGRLVHCQETCSHMKDFKESVGMVFRTALWRGYSRRLVQSVWSRFLFQRWHSTDIRVKELRVWFSKVWRYLQSTDCKTRPDPARPVPNLGAAQNSRFLQAFGVPDAASSRREPQAQPGSPAREAVEPPVPHSPLSSAPTVPMDQDVGDGAVVLVSQPSLQVTPVAGQAEQALAPMAVDPGDEQRPQEEAARPQAAAQPEVVAVALVEEVRRAAVLVSASGDQLVRHAEVEVRQRASFSSETTQISLQRSARAIHTEVFQATTEEGLDEDEAGLEEVRTEGYLLGSPAQGSSFRVQGRLGPRLQTGVRVVPLRRARTPQTALG